MGDFDFEELDKAVNNVLGGPAPADKNVAQEARPSSTEVAKTPAPASASTPTPEPAPEAESEPEPESTPTPVSTPAPAPVAVPKSEQATQPPVIMPSRGSAGRSEVRPVIDIMAPSRRPSREGPIVAPSPRGAHYEALKEDYTAPAHASEGALHEPTGVEESLSLEPTDSSTSAAGLRAGASADLKDDTLEAASAAVGSMDSTKRDTPILGEEKPDAADLTKFNDLSRSNYSSGSVDAAESSTPDLEPTHKPVSVNPSEKDETQLTEDKLSASTVTPEVAAADTPATGAGAQFESIDPDAVKNELEKAADTPDELKSTPADTPEPATGAAPAEVEKESSHPSVSPFLTDAKVEKRPLGGGSASAPEASLQLDDSSDASSAGAATEHVVAGGQPHGAYKFTDDHQELNVNADAGADAPRPVFDTKEYHAPAATGNSLTQKLGGNGLLIGAIGFLALALIIAVVVFFFL